MAVEEAGCRPGFCFSDRARDGRTNKRRRGALANNLFLIMFVPEMGSHV
jgi:hypothetical protein